MVAIAIVLSDSNVVSYFGKKALAKGITIFSICGTLAIIGALLSIIGKMKVNFKKTLKTHKI